MKTNKPKKPKKPKKPEPARLHYCLGNDFLEAEPDIYGDEVIAVDVRVGPKLLDLAQSKSSEQLRQSMDTVIGQHVEDHELWAMLAVCVSRLVAKEQL